MSPRLSTALFALLVAALLVPAAGGAVTTSASDVGVAQQETPTPVTENTTFYLQLEPNGDARWTITDTYALEDANDTDAFEQLGQRFEDGETDAGWERAFRQANRAAVEATGREMNITGVERDYVVGERRGQLVLTFTWTNFATVEGDRLVVDDAFNTSDGTWFDGLTADQRLVISAPAGYGVQNSPPQTAVVDGELRFEGPREFDPTFLEIVYTGDQERTTSPATETPDGEGLLGSLPPWLGGALVLVGLGGVVWYLQRHSDADLPSPAATDDGDGDDGDGPDDDEPTPAAEGANGDTEAVDVELLSDEERVERLLEENGGRMKQARIVKETGWSNAKVSQLLSSMDEADRIDKLRIGRENLISFPDEDVADIDE
ncbi:helix-turn-helix transcriptional regulator [Haloarcula litorea]|uniref:helix-turn-helix transcriptional regulator n=1 Tax=Haloarcula litorea TaxID=3032579 RepID=UPI0023E8CE86|nr:hypothetical protein [Halomicroarcula sp. GDY20]